jgi:hypothetical protein
MRQLVIVVFLISSLILMMQCSENESLNVFNEKMVTTTAPSTKGYAFLPYFYRLCPDSIRWIFEYPSNGPSRVSIILSGQIKTDSIVPPPVWLLGYPSDSIDIGIGQNHIDVGVETDTSGAPSILPIALDEEGKFLDTIPIAVAPVSSMILAAKTRLFVTKLVDSENVLALDTILLADPHAAGGQK